MSNPPPAASNTTSSDDQFARTERKARRFWVGLIVSFLSIQVIIGFGSVYLAIGDPTVAIIPNYHQSALDWDVTHRAHETLRQLGWDVKASVLPIASDRRAIVVQVVGPQAEPIQNLNIEARLFHHARGTTVYRAMLQESEPGVYVADTQLTRPGLWQVDLSLEGEHGIASSRNEVEVK